VDLSRGAIPLNRRVQLGFGLAILILATVNVFAYRSAALLGKSERCVRHTNEVLVELRGLRLALAGIDGSELGFLVTDQKSYVESYWAGTQSAKQSIAAVRKLTADNPKQQDHTATLEELLAKRVQFGDLVINLRRENGLDATKDAIESKPYLGLLTEFGTVVGEMQDEELRLLLLRDAAAKRRSIQVKFALIYGTTLSLLITLAAGWGIRRDSTGSDLAAALRESEERYRMLLDGVREYAIYMMDPEGQVLSWNAGAERIKGYTSAQILGRHFSCFFSREDIERGRPDELLRLTAANGRYEEQSMRVRKDGSRFLANLTFTALRDPAGNLRGFSEFSHDLSENQESEAKYRGLLEAAPDAMVVVSQSGEIVLLNLQAEKQFGYRRDELVGQAVKNIIPEGFAERLIADSTRSAADALAQQIGTGIELYGRRKDGSDFPIEIMLSPLKSAEGILVTAAIRDISLRKAAEKHLDQMEGRYRGLLEAAPDAMVVVNQDGEIVLLNVQAEKRFGYRRDELAGQKVKSIIPEGFAERLIADGTRTAADALAQQIGMGIELYGRRKDGSVFPIEIMLSPLESPEGILVTAAIRDITERKKSEERLLHMVGELKRSNDELQQFAYVSSHDLQEPLRMVASYTQLLARRYKGRLDSDADEFIAFAVDGCNRMQSLIHDLLAFSRAGTNGKPLCEISSEDALNEALTNLQATIEESEAVVTRDPLPIIRTDDTQLTQVFQNLVGNAIKYRNVVIPHIHISATRNGDSEYIFSVRDNGIGIAPQYFERIFILFQRLHGRNEFAGTGIGLAICKKMLERLGGRIWLESEPGNGSTFFFALPDTDEKRDEK
jgi:PAS domain S-box-containing protein